jgi:tetratricopeptide (TPR) repeat protein
MPSSRESVDPFVALPDPGQAGTLDDLVEQLRLLKVWAGDPSYESITNRVNAAWTGAGRPSGELAGRTTVVDCFRPGRRRLNTDLVTAVVHSLHPDVGYVTQWQQALQVIGGQTRAASQVRVQDSLPPDLAGFTGRTTELGQLRHALDHSRQDGGAVVISAIAGMAGVGKTQLAIHAGHLLARERSFDRVLFVNLRGFHPDPNQPPADPAAVLDGFLRLLGVPGHKIPSDLRTRTAAYRDCLAGIRTLVVLDNATDEDQVRPLLPGGPDCVTLITSRRSLTALHPAAHLAVDMFTPEEALEFVIRAAPQVPIGEDPDAAARITRRCGYLPLALGLVTGHIRATPGWTLTDHADRLDERHQVRRLDTAMELALDLSYRWLSADRRRMLRLVALHPGQDLDAYAAAALADSGLSAAQAVLRDLCRDHLLQQNIPGRYTFHDLVRAYATGRAGDEDSPPQRRAALTRLFDYCLGAAATAMDTLYPAETYRRPRIHPAGTPKPDLANPDTARTWLDTECSTLVAVAAHTATDGWPAHTTRLSTTLYRYLTGGNHADAIAVHSHAHHAARQTNDLTGQAEALVNLGAARMRMNQHGLAAGYFQQALTLLRQAGGPVEQARVQVNLSNVEVRQGRYRLAADHFQQALTLLRQAGDPVDQARVLINLSDVEVQLGRYRQATDHIDQALILCDQAGHRYGEALARHIMGEIALRQGRYRLAAGHFRQALTLHRTLGNRIGEAWTLDSLGTFHTKVDQPTEHHRQALCIFREVGDRQGEACALNGLGEAANSNGRPDDALTHHTTAHTIAADIGDRDQQARAHTGLARAHLSLDNPTQARRHYQHALTLYTDLDMPEADQIRAHLTSIDNSLKHMDGHS